MDRPQTLEERLADLEAVIINQADRIEALEELIDAGRTVAIGHIRFKRQKREDEAA